MANNKTYLPKPANWFRLPEYVKQIIGAGNVEAIDTADATDEATAITLANANKAKINELIQVLVSATIITSEAEA